MKNTTSLRTTAFAPYAITVLASLCPAQGSFTTFGQSCQEGLSLSVANTPRIGQTFLIRYLGIIGSAWIGNRSQIAQPLLLFGTSTTQSGTTPLPYLLPLWVTGGATNCQIYVSPDVSAPMPLNAAPPFTLGMAIPANQSLVGFTFHLQWCTLTMNSVNGVPTTSSIVSSNAGTAVIGN